MTYNDNFCTTKISAKSCVIHEIGVNLIKTWKAQIYKRPKMSKSAGLIDWYIRQNYQMDPGSGKAWSAETAQSREVGEWKKVDPRAEHSSTRSSHKDLLRNFPVEHAFKFKDFGDRFFSLHTKETHVWSRKFFFSVESDMGNQGTKCVKISIIPKAIQKTIYRTSMPSLLIIELSIFMIAVLIVLAGGSFVKAILMAFDLFVSSTTTSLVFALSAPAYKNHAHKELVNRSKRSATRPLTSAC